MPRKKKVSEKQVMEEERAWDLYARGRTQRTIAKEMNISLSKANVLLKGAHARHSKFLDDDVKRYYDKHLSQLEHIAEEALKSWEDDLKSRGRHDADYLETAMRSIEQIRKIIYGKKQEEYESSTADDRDPLARIMELVDGARARRNFTSAEDS